MGIENLIIIGSLKNLSPLLDYTDIRIDRTSVLGNPFELTKEEDRKKVCNAYKEWLLSNLTLASLTSNPLTSVNLSQWSNLKIADKYKYPTPQQVKKEIKKIFNLIKYG